MFLRYVIIICLLICFPVSSMQINAMNPIEQVAFLYRLKQLKDDLMKLQKSKNHKKIRGVLKKIMSEIEVSCNIQLSINDALKSCKKEFERQNKKISKKDWKEVVDKIKGKSKSRHVLDKQKEGKNPDEQQDRLPDNLIWGITCMCSGFFLRMIPIPVCHQIGQMLIGAGFSMCSNAITSKTEADKKREEEEKGRYLCAT